MTHATPNDPFPALIVEEQADGSFTRRIGQRRVTDLPDGEVLIDVQYSSLNYKDALSASGNRGVTRHYPHTPGIDAVGVVRSRRSAAWREGDPVIVTGHDLGSNTSGGLAGRICVPADWVVALPPDMTARHSMAMGTAGFTVALGLHRLEHEGLTPGSGDVLITGATGGVGSLGVALFSKLGHRVVALTGKMQMADYLSAIGAAEVLDRRQFVQGSDKPLWSSRWSAVLDSVGGPILAAALKGLAPGGAAAICGLAASAELNTTVYPFILRGASILGVSSADCPLPLRQQLWSKLASPWSVPHLDTIVREIALQEVGPAIDAILDGTNHGRVVVRIGQGG